MAEVRRMVNKDRFDYLLVESTGVFELISESVTFFFRNQLGSALEDISRLDTMVTVVKTAKCRADRQSK